MTNHRADYAAFNTVIEAYCDVKAAQIAAWTGYNNLDFTADCESCFPQALKDPTDLAMFYAVFVTGDVREAEAPAAQIDKASPTAINHWPQFPCRAFIWSPNLSVGVSPR